MAGSARDPIDTLRLRLTPVSSADLDDLVELYADPLVARWTGPWDHHGVRRWTEDMAARWAEDRVGKWMARTKDTATLVGRGGFSRIELDGEVVLELGWVVRDALTGRGYATEIGRAALDWATAFHPDLPIVSFTELHNQASRAVMRHLGLRPAGVIHREGLVEGRTGLHPNAPFALYRLTESARRPAQGTSAR